MPDDPRIKIHDFPHSLLEGSSELSICLAQTPPPQKDEIRGGIASSLLMPFLRSLFLTQDGGRLNEMLPGQKSILILIPEFAISMRNWPELDAMVRQLNRNAIVIGGIGVTESSELREWKKEEGEGGTGATARIFGFSEDEVSGAHRYNVGCCWTHTPSQGTQCVLFLKNYLERASEALNIDGLGEGSHLLCIQTHDTYIYPLICAEFTSRQEVGKPLYRIRTHLMSQDKAARKKVLITGVSYEPTSSHDLWREGINESVHLLPDYEIVTAIVNNALDPCASNEVKDRWRCLSGVFTARPNAKDQAANQPSRPLIDDPNVIGVMCRTGSAQAICGKISWDLSRGGTRYLWRATHRSLADVKGLLKPSDTGDVYLDEMRRFIRRYSPDVDCNGSRCPKLKTCKFPKGGLFTASIHSGCGERSVLNRWKSSQTLLEHLETSSDPNARTMMNSILSGPRAKDHNPDSLSHFEVGFLQKGLHVTGALKLRPSSSWPPPGNGVGQLIDNERRFQILVWVDPSLRGADIRADIEAWSRNGQAGMPLLAVVQGFSGSCREGVVNPRDPLQRRGDLASPPLPEDQRSIETHRGKKAAIVALAKIEDCFGTNNLEAAVEQQLENTLNKLVPKQ